MATIVRHSAKGSAGLLISELGRLDGLPDAPSCIKDLEADVLRRALEPAESIGEHLPFVGFTGRPVPNSVVRRTNGRWFVASDYRDDVAFRQDRFIAVPQGELSRLRRLNSAGVSFDHVWIAHEMPGEWNPDEPLPTIVPDAPHVRNLDEALESSTRTMLQLAARAASAIVKTAISVGAAAATVGTAIALDPVIVGGIEHPREPLVAWMLLAQWDW